MTELRKCDTCYVCKAAIDPDGFWAWGPFAKEPMRLYCSKEHLDQDKRNTPNVYSDFPVSAKPAQIATPEPRKCEHCGKELELVCEKFLNGMPMYFMCPCKESQAAADANLMAMACSAFGWELVDPREVVQEQVARAIPYLRERGPI